jgi:hypothetical protein
MSFAESEKSTLGSDVLEETNCALFDVESNFSDVDIYELYCTATVTYNGEVKKRFTYKASTSGGLANACRLAQRDADNYIAQQNTIDPNP